MNEPVHVEAHIDSDGGVRPVAFRWQGERKLIASVGRSWSEAGERRFLVMTANEQVYELAYLPDQASWRLRRRPRDFRPPGEVV
jgi:hypothetical protein